MKKVVLLLLGIIIGLAIAYFYFGTDSEADASKYAEAGPPKGVITEAQGIVLNNAYTPRYRLVSDSIVRRDDNRSSWYSLQDVRDYLSYAENQARELGYTLTGVRVYLGAYPESGGQAGYTTMFLAPTGTKGTSNGSMINFALDGDGDIPGGSPLNAGGNGEPPNGNYPNN